MRAGSGSSCSIIVAPPWGGRIAPREHLRRPIHRQRRDRRRRRRGQRRPLERVARALDARDDAERAERLLGLHGEARAPRHRADQRVGVDAQRVGGEREQVTAAPVRDAVDPREGARPRQIRLDVRVGGVHPVEDDPLAPLQSTRCAGRAAPTGSRPSRTRRAPRRSADRAPCDPPCRGGACAAASRARSARTPRRAWGPRDRARWVIWPRSPRPRRRRAGCPPSRCRRRRRSYMSGMRSNGVVSAPCVSPRT